MAGRSTRLMKARVEWVGPFLVMFFFFLFLFLGLVFNILVWAFLK